MTATDAPADPGRVKTSLPPELLDVPTEAGPLTTFLGLFSIGLGLWEAACPRQVADATGVRYPGLLRAYGAREIAAGIGVFTSPHPGRALWARVAGDALDLATIGAAYLRARGPDRRKAAVAAAAVLGVTVLDILAAESDGRA